MRYLPLPTLLSSQRFAPFSFPESKPASLGDKQLHLTPGYVAVEILSACDRSCLDCGKVSVLLSTKLIAEPSRGKFNIRAGYDLIFFDAPREATFF